MKHADAVEQARAIHSIVKSIRHHLFQQHGLPCPEGGRELTLAQVHAVMAVRAAGTLTISQLAEMLGVSMPSASSMVDRLVQKGALVREQSEEDRRKVLVRVSPEAEEDIALFEERILESMVRVVERIGEDTAKTWRAVLEKVLAAVQEEEQE